MVLPMFSVLQVSKELSADSLPAKFAREAKLLGLITSNFQGATIRPSDSSETEKLNFKIRKTEGFARPTISSAPSHYHPDSQTSENQVTSLFAPSINLSQMLFSDWPRYSLFVLL